MCVTFSLSNLEWPHPQKGWFRQPFQTIKPKHSDSWIQYDVFGFTMIWPIFSKLPSLFWCVLFFVRDDLLAQVTLRGRTVLLPRQVGWRGLNKWNGWWLFHCFVWRSKSYLSKQFMPWGAMERHTNFSICHHHHHHHHHHDHHLGRKKMIHSSSLTQQWKFHEISFVPLTNTSTTGGFFMAMLDNRRAKRSDGKMHGQWRTKDSWSNLAIHR